ncbi:MAG: glycerophosphodiester phosphodiesterase family protein [Bacteroidota bacterium]
MKSVLLILLLGSLMSCNQSPKRLSDQLDIQGHRGARGLLPENTIPAFLKALEYNVTTLELDLAVTADNQLVVSHEPWMNHSICTDSVGEAISEEAERSFNIYQMTYDEVAGFDCGSLGNPRFPEQKAMNVSKPLLMDLFDAVDDKLGGSSINYNIEIKSNPQGDNLFHPTPQQFSDLVYSTIDGRVDWKYITIQSFDFRVLQYFNEKYPDVQLAALIENQETPAQNIATLGFTPDIYSSWYKDLTADDVRYLHDQNVLVVPWTVNELEDMQMLVGWGVDGIITDYPDRAVNLSQ